MSLNESEKAAVHEYVRNFDGHPRIKVAILGEEGVGKGSFVGRLNCDRFFDNIIDTHGDQTFAARCEIVGKTILLNGDTLMPPDPAATSHDPVYTLNHRALRHVETCVLMYDVGDSASFDRIRDYWRDILAERSLDGQMRCSLRCSPLCPARPTPYPGIVYVFANKMDRRPWERTVPEANGRAFADSIGANFASISVKTGEGSGKKVLEDLTMRTLERRIQNEGGWLDKYHRVQTESMIVTRQNARFWY